MKGYLPILITLLMFGCGRRPNTVRISYLQNDTLTEEPEILISADRQKGRKRIPSFQTNQRRKRIHKGFYYFPRQTHCLL